MEKLALTCNVLYKQDLLDKKKEIDEIKESFKGKIGTQSSMFFPSDRPERL